MYLPFDQLSIKVYWWLAKLHCRELMFPYCCSGSPLLVLKIYMQLEKRGIKKIKACKLKLWTLRRWSPYAMFFRIHNQTKYEVKIKEKWVWWYAWMDGKWTVPPNPMPIILSIWIVLWNKFCPKQSSIKKGQ